VFESIGHEIRSCWWQNWEASSVFKIWQRGGHGERAEYEPITGVLGRSPQRGPGAEPLFGESRGQSPRKAETLFCF